MADERERKGEAPIGEGEHGREAKRDEDELRDLDVGEGADQVLAGRKIAGDPCDGGE